MALEKPKPRESEEQSIKARKNQLFEEQSRQAAPSGPKKPIHVYLRDTPAMPISPGVKATLWVAAALVLLLFLAALMTRGGRPERPRTGGISPALERRQEEAREAIRHIFIKGNPCLDSRSDHSTQQFMI